ncbi:NAD(P)/FAD-dependent oxidoreductase [Chiayiivirga flava]|uniref:3-phenylpropionate/trans-cinnamate dioxygenase ferredoxin reductase subunit n=1 Tax=Chiayiivirga flava TaxID=659595 RepID=A0A7W8D4E7_9GAMM|nr:FAD-dependent oxidoreductase [Chiayiivirga flava]MBB5206491.1 3-phenylpropionate/trans-cinnamate dioxygenase ferredoxin reductase subunit [Chiayiivirga flava]
MIPHPASIVIVGAGHAGGTAAIELRRLGYAGALVLVGDEVHPPYQRPPLSKAFLGGAVEPQALSLKPAAFYAEHAIERVVASVASIDRAARRVLLDDGRSIAYETLILATGARARQLDVPGAELDGVFHLRGIDDAQRLRAALRPGLRLAVVGGGYVGLEVAAAARGLGLEVCVIEREPRLLARVASPAIGDFYATAHRARGVEVRTGTRVTAFAGSHAVTGVVLADGSEIACDAVLVGVGAMALDTLARAAGLECENGIVVDADARTRDSHVYAIGDATWRPLPLYDGRHARLESVSNALEQARRAAHGILGLPLPAHEVPWFWSEQFDLRLQIAGLAFDCDTTVLRGAPADGKFAVFHLRGDRVLAAEAVNVPLDFLAAKQFIAAGTAIDPAKLADPAIKAKDSARA